MLVSLIFFFYCLTDLARQVRKMACRFFLGSGEALQARWLAGYQTALHNMGLMVPIEGLILRSPAISAGRECADIGVLYTHVQGDSFRER